MYTGKRKKKDVPGSYLYGGTLIQKGEVYYDQPFNLPPRRKQDTVDVAAGIAWAKCVIASTCSYETADANVDFYTYSPVDNPYDLYAALMSGPKWHRVNVQWVNPKKPSSAKDFVDAVFEPNHYIRNFCADFVPARYQNCYDGSYVNCGSDLSGFVALCTKLKGFPDSSGAINSNNKLSAHQTLSTTMLLLDRLKFYRAELPFDASKKVLMHNYYRSYAAFGFDAFAKSASGKKGEYLKIQRQHLKWIHYQVFSLGKRWEDVLPLPGFTVATKLEVRGPEVARDKIRLTMTNNMVTDYVYELLLRPLYIWSKSLPFYLGGVSVRGNQIPKILRAIRHPYARTWYENCAIYSGPCALIDEDMGSQDVTFTSREKLLYYLVFAAFFRQGDHPLQPKVNELFAYLMSWGCLQLIEMWGGNYYLVEGMNATGNKLTALMALMMGLYNHFAAFMTWRENDYVEVLNHLWFCIFGDDKVTRCPVPVARSVFGRDLRKYALHCQDVLQINIKPSESNLLYPTRNHKDRTFTWVEDDEIVSRGLVMLKRFIVKLDENCRIIHPDSEDFKCLALFRPTADYVSRFSLDPANWNCEKVSSWIKWFRKQFGLLIDACANRTAHEMIKAAVLVAKEEHPAEWDVACSGLESSVEYLEHCKKFGEISPALMSYIFDSPDSFKVVISLYLPVLGEPTRLDSSVFNKCSSWDLP